MLSRSPHRALCRALRCAPFLLLVLAPLTACAPPPQAPEVRSVAEMDAALGSWPPPLPEAHPPLARVPEKALASGRERARDPGRTAPPPRRSGRRVDVALNHAALDAALQMLATEAGVGLVLPDPLGATVSVSLRRVDPLEALVTLAEAQGLQVERQEQVFIVRRR